MSIRFHADDETLRPMGRATSGVIGMRFTNGDRLLGMHVIEVGAGPDVLVATGGGYAKRTPADMYPVQGRGGLGVVTARIVEARGELIGALMVGPDDEVFAITSAGGVIRHLGGRDQAVGPADHGGPAGQSQLPARRSSRSRETRRSRTPMIQWPTTRIQMTWTQRRHRATA